MASIPYIDTKNLHWERIGRSLLEYGGIPLALFMTLGIAVNIMRGYGYYQAFLDPVQNYYLYFVVNVWVVGLIYFYRQRYQDTLLLSGKKELLTAAIAAFTWVLSQPVYLIIGYIFFMIAILRQDTLHGSFLPDLTDLSDEDEDSDEHAWGHLESVKDNMTV